MVVAPVVATDVRIAHVADVAVAAVDAAAVIASGEMVDEVAGAIRLLLGPDAKGLTGQVIHADCGRVM